MPPPEVVPEVEPVSVLVQHCTLVMEDDLDDGALLEGMARMLGERLGLKSEDDPLGGLPYGESLLA